MPSLYSHQFESYAFLQSHWQPAFYHVLLDRSLLVFLWWHSLLLLAGSFQPNFYLFLLQKIHHIHWLVIYLAVHFENIFWILLSLSWFSVYEQESTAFNLFYYSSFKNHKKEWENKTLNKTALIFADFKLKIFAWEWLIW